MNAIECTSCGSNQLQADGTLWFCPWCRTSFTRTENAVQQPPSIVDVHGDIDALLRKCETDPENRSRYASLVLDLDPGNPTARAYLGEESAVKAKDIAAANSFDPYQFEQWVRQSNAPHSISMWTNEVIVDDLNVPEVVHNYQQFLTESAHREAEAQQAEEQKRQALAAMLITSGFNFDGYTITRYSGYISGDDVASIERPRQGWFGGVDGNAATDLTETLVKIRRNAINELKEAAYALGRNAVIGVDFDYITLDPETSNNKGGTLYLPFLFAVTANGNAVTIQRNE